MGATFSRLKNWIAETLTYADLNAEIDNILNNLGPAGVDDYSVNTTQMRLQTDPGELGTEVPATSLAGEIERLRKMLSEITGKTYWYQSPDTSLANIISSIGGGFPPNRIASGRIRAGSSQGIFLVPNGAARTVTLNGTSTPFVYYVNNTQYTISTSPTITSLTAAPSSQNTALVNDATILNTADTKLAGEYTGEIVIDNVGTEITALVGKVAGFKIVHGGNTEYFIAKVETNKLTRVKRGYFFDSADAAIPRITINDNATITLMKLSWIFAKTDGTLAVTYNNPRSSADEPTSPAIGDYWFDTVNDIWKVYSGTSFASAGATPIGCCIQDTTNTVAARSFDFFKPHAETNTIELFFEGNAEVRSRAIDSQIQVYGSPVKFDKDFARWDMTLNLDSGVTEGASTYYYFYVTETGDVIISDVAPADRREDLLGFYHPHQTWRCVGSAFNNGSSNLTAVNSYYTKTDSIAVQPLQTGLSNIQIIERVVPLDSTSAAFTKTLPPAAYWKGQTITFIKTSSDLNAITIDGYASETINGAASIKVNTQYESVTLLSDGTNVIITNRHIPPFTATYTATITGCGTVADNTGFRYIRRGNFMRVSGSWTAGTVAASALTIALPTGPTLDTALMQINAESYGLMWGNANTTGTQIPATSRGPFYVSIESGYTTTVGVGNTIDTNTPGAGPVFYVGNGSDIISSSTKNSVTFEVPITGWRD